ncbi:MAG: hypothetical protein ABH841_02975 [Candidatus Nealsonbacteria bacterium]
MDFIKTISKRKILLICLSALLIIGGVFCFKYLNKTTVEEFNMSGKVLSVNASQSFLILKPMSKESEVKVFISKTTKLMKFEASFAKDNPPPPGTQFTPTKTEVSLGDLRQGDEIFLKSSKNILGKKNINDVEFIQVLP